MLKALLQKIGPFLVIGLCGTVIDFGLTYTIKERFKAHKYVANTTGFATAATANFMLARFWMYSSHGDFWTEYLKFLVVSITGLGINTMVIFGVSYILNKFPHEKGKITRSPMLRIWNWVIGVVFNIMDKILKDPEKRNFYVSKMAATAVVLVWNFLVPFFFIFHAASTVK